MKDVIIDFIAELNAITVVNTFAGTNIYPNVGPDGIAKMVVYSPRGGIRKSYYKDSFGLATLVIQLDIYSTSLSDNLDVLEAIENKFNGFSGEINNRTDILRAYVLDHSEAVDAYDSDVKRTTIDISLTF